jgi:hypothetical protein
MKRFVKLVALLVCAALLHGCAMEQHYTILANGSGQFNLTADMSTFLSMAPDSEFMRNELANATVRAPWWEALKHIRGIYDASADVAGDTLSIHYRFLNTKALRKASALREEGVLAGALCIKGNGRHYTLRPAPELHRLLNKRAHASPLAVADNDSLQITVRVHFERKIKKFSSKIATFDPLTNSVTFCIHPLQLSPRTLRQTTRVELE